MSELGSGIAVGIHAEGKNRETLELDALDKAREFFGPGPHLMVKRDYIVTVMPDGRFLALVMVREVCGE